MDKKYKLLCVVPMGTDITHPGVQEFMNSVVANTRSPAYKYYAENMQIYHKLAAEGKESEYKNYMKFDTYPSGAGNSVINEPYIASKRLFDSFDTEALMCTEFGQVDLKEAIEVYEPDLIMFAPSGEFQTPDHPRANFPARCDAYPEIPRILHCNFDKISPLSSAGFIIGEDLGVEANFSNSLVDGEFDWLPFPSFYYPQSMFVSNQIFKDYGQKKEFTVGMFGAGYYNDGFYPWRGEVTSKLAGKFPLVHFPQPFHTGKMHINIPRVRGAEYSRMINRCQFGLACGSVAHTVLAKHFEIPASRTCLLTEDSVFLREHGFVDGQTCVCVTPENVVEKIEYYLCNLDELQKITDNGYEFVQSKCLAEKIQNNLLSWFELRKELQQGEKIIQTGLFDFKIVAKNDNTTRRFERGSDRIVQSWREGFSFLQQGEMQKAQACFSETLGYVGYEPLGRLGMGLVNLFSKNAKVCMQYLEAILAHEQNQGGLEDYHDPVDIAYYIIASLCVGEVQRAFAVSKMWTNHTHYALEAARRIAAAAAKQMYDQAAEAKALSVHSRCPVIISSVEGWINHFRDVFKIYGITI